MPALRITLGAAAVAFVAASAAAQGPDAEWRTLESEHFSVHFPAATEAWATRLAARLEALRRAVGAEVGYLPPQRVEVLVADPAAEANGSAWPLLGAPRMVLWATPPAAGSALAHATDWGELVAIHEYAHLAHLLRPSRHPLRQRLEGALWPVGPLPLRAPRWAVEGYATLVEGRLSGSGRPHSALRAAILRAWARAGRLPSYARLSRDGGRFMGSAMAYWVGSRFLEWSAARDPAGDALPRLWAAATARADRGFVAAWGRVFGEPPEASYARFVAEESARALADERQRTPRLREGEVWLDRDWATGEPAVSRDGGELAAIVRRKQRPARVVVWSLAADGAAAGAATARRAPPVDADDPPAIAGPPRERPTARALEEPPGTRFDGARFLPGGGDLLLAARAPDARGDLHGDLFLWRAAGGLERLTRRADLRAADPHPGGELAVAARWRAGASQLVLVDLGSGDVHELTPPRVDTVHDAPRFAPAGDQLAWLEQRGGRWRLMRAAFRGARGGLESAREEALGDAEPTHLAWRGDASHLYVALAGGDEIEIHALPIAAGARPHRVTRSLDAAFAPAPTPDGRWLFYLSLDPGGVDLHRLDLDAATEQKNEEAAFDVPAAEPAAVAPAPGEVLPPSRSYGFGRAAATPLVGGWLGSASGPLEVGLRLGDALGRWQLAALGAVGDREDRRGGAVAAAWRGGAVRWSAHVAALREDAAEAEAFELGGARELVVGRGALSGALTLGWARRDRQPTARRAEIALAGASAWRRGGFSLRPSLAGRLTEELAPEERRWWRVEAALALAAGRSEIGLAAARHDLDGAPDETARWRLGGPPSALAPRTLEPQRIDNPALPDRLLAAPRIDSLSVRLRPGGRPFVVFGERHRARALQGGREEVELAGLESAWALPELPVAGLPALELRLGAARLLSGAGEGHTRWWLGLSVPLSAVGSGSGAPRAR